MLTSAGVVTVLVSALVLAAGRTFGLPELFVVGAAGLIVVALAIVYVALRRLNVEVSRQLSPARVHAGNACRIDLLLRNRSRFSSPVLRLRDDVSGTQGVELLVAPMRHGAGTRAIYRLPTDRRGVIRVGPLRLTVTDPFGIARLTTTGDQEVSVIVYPRIDDLNAIRRSSGSDMDRETLLQHQVSPTGDEFYALRPYVVGDDLRRVHWPSSARHDDLMVRQDEIPWHGRLTVLLDTRPGPSPAAFEQMVSAAASIAAASIRRGDQVRLVTTDSHELPFAAGPHHLDRILESLAVVEQQTRKSLTRPERVQSAQSDGAIAAVSGHLSQFDDGLLRESAGGYRHRVLVLFTEEGATALGQSRPLRSTTVITVTPQQDFADAWIRALGTNARVAVTAPEAEASGRPDVLVAASELALFAVTLSAVAGFVRVFNDDSWLSPLVFAAIAAHLTMALCRRVGRGLVVASVAGLVGLTLQLTWTHYRGTTTALLPTRGTRAALDADLTAAWDLFGEVRAPTESATGFVVLATMAIWMIAYLADWAAFRLWSPLESVLPSFSVFVFISFFGEVQNRLTLAGLYVAALIAFQLFHRMVRQAHEVRWLAGSSWAGTTSLLSAGGMLSVVAVVGAIAIGPVLPGANEGPIVDLETRYGGPSTRIVISPIVDIRGRLVDQPDVEAFTVRSDVPSYWRLASLDTFNGQIWGADNRYETASGPLPDDLTIAIQTEVEVANQTFTILNMGAVWLPAAYEPRALTSDGEGQISYEATSGTLIVSTDLESSDGLEYSVVSELPRFSPETLVSAGSDLPGEIRDSYLDLPDDFSANATTIAQNLTAGLASEYDKALALQDYFRQGFDYNQNVGAGHSSNRIDQFLTTREGYCEQFAGAYAAMARSIGLPARVAVGFTWGEPDPDDPTLYHVRGEHAHAWPEVFIAGAGWVPFEPTPGRGAPNAAAWTGVEPAQASATGDTSLPETAPPSTLPPGATDPDFTDFDFPEETPQSQNPGQTREGTAGWVKAVRVILLAALALVAFYVGAVIIAKRVRRQRRLAAATDARDRVGVIWHNTLDTLEPLGLSQPRSETVDEFASRAAPRAGAARTQLVELSQLVTTASFAPQLPDGDTLVMAEQHHDGIVEAVNNQLDWATRAKSLLDPRPLFRRKRR